MNREDKIVLIAGMLSVQRVAWDAEQCVDAARRFVDAAEKCVAKERKAASKRIQEVMAELT